MGLFQQALFHAPLGCFAAKKHLFHPLRLDCGRRNRHKSGARAVGMLVDKARRHFFARSSRTGEHNATVGLGDLFQMRFQCLEGRACPQHLGRADITAAQIGVFAAQAACLHRARNDHHQLVNVEGLFDEVIGPLLDRGDRDFNVAMARDDDNRNVRIVALHGFQDVDPIHPAVLQPDIQDHQRRRFGIDLGHALVGVRGQPHGIALVLQNIANQFANVFFIIGDKNTGHLSSLPAWGILFALPLWARGARGR